MTRPLTRWLHPLLFSLLFAPLAACPGSGGGPLPEPDQCASPAAGAVVDTLEVDVSEVGAFTPVADDAIVSLVRGGQGGQMLPVRLRITGAAAPACLAQTTQLSLGANLAGFVDAPLSTYADGAARTTKVLYVILYAPIRVGETFTLQTSAGGKTLTRRLWYGPHGDGGTTP